MNEQKAPKGIEWTRVNGRRGYTWNPTAGCLRTSGQGVPCPYGNKLADEALLVPTR